MENHGGVIFAFVLFIICAVLFAFQVDNEAYSKCRAINSESVCNHILQ